MGVVNVLLDGAAEAADRQVARHVGATVDGVRVYNLLHHGGELLRSHDVAPVAVDHDALSVGRDLDHAAALGAGRLGVLRRGGIGCRRVAVCRIALTLTALLALATLILAKEPALFDQLPLALAALGEALGHRAARSRSILVLLLSGTAAAIVVVARG